MTVTWQSTDTLKSDLRSSAPDEGTTGNGIWPWTFQMSAAGLKDRAEGLRCHLRSSWPQDIPRNPAEAWKASFCQWDVGQVGFHYLPPSFNRRPGQRLPVSNSKRSGGAYLAKQPPPLTLSNKFGWNIPRSNALLPCAVPVAPGMITAQLLGVFQEQSLIQSRELALYY